MTKKDKIKEWLVDNIAIICFGIFICCIFSFVIIVSIKAARANKTSNISSNNTYDTSLYDEPNILTTSDINNDGYYYIIDNNSGVVYLGYYTANKKAMTIMFNADGTVMNVNDIKKNK